MFEYSPPDATLKILEAVRQDAEKYGGIDGLIAHVTEVAQKRADEEAASLRRRLEAEKHVHTGNPVAWSTQGHKKDSPKLDPDCPVCDDMYATRQRVILAAARVVRDSTVLSEREPQEQVQEWDHETRAQLALTYVENIHHTYASGDDFDNRFHGVWPDWKAFAEQQADDMLDEGSNGTMLQRYFDYEGFARDLKHDYDVIEIYGSDRNTVIVMTQ